ncbi:MAG: pyridoxamine 5'-phosphate oxidase family protein [Acidobacteriaceae bacterium]|nr:pyridoxamine 5'-phosphate oxidase family protein [Acidobacteriaceae bacterium]
MKSGGATNRTQVMRLPNRGDYSQETIHSILDAGFLCHVGFVVDGQPFVIPTGYGRSGNTLYFHGSAASRMLRTLASGVEVCVTVTLLDSLVLARSAFHHSMNYRSVVLFGAATLVDSVEEKTEALRVISEQIVPGRWNDIRWPTEQELKATKVLALPITEASAKVRIGPPLDDEEDYAMNVWAGILPLRVHAEQPVPDPRLSSEITAVPDYLLHYGKRPI